MTDSRPSSPRPTRRALAAAGDALRRVDSERMLVEAARAARRKLPGDERYGDPLSLTGDDAPQLLGRRLAALSEERPSALRELGMSTLQVWQALSEAQGRGQGTEEIAILFTDLVGFSDWALEAGDAAAVDLLRRVGQAVEEPVRARGGRVVKRLGDGLMAVFTDPAPAVQAACEASGAVARLEVDAGTPRLRAGIHVGRPRKLGGDYFGVDVNVAARIAAAAAGDEVLISDAVRERLDPAEISTRRRWRFKPKGTPKGLKAFVAEPVGAS
jgi:adenylate cyclase